MKVGILTHYNVLNQGALLQLYALRSWLCAHGHTPVVLTYDKNFDFAPAESRKNNVSLRSVPYYLRHYLLENGPGLTVFNARKHFAFSRLLRESFDFADYRADGLDAVIVGSDEVFSIDVGVNKMMYGHGLRCGKRIAYAPSFGRTTAALLEETGCLETVQSGLAGFSALSARDGHTQSLIRELTGREAELVCDPVLLWDFADLAPKRRPPRSPYLAVYAYSRHLNAPEEVAAIRGYAEKNGLALLSCGTYHGWCDKSVVCDPLDWYGYMRGAAAIVTDTFHGCAVGLKTNRPTAVFVRPELNAGKLGFLLQQTGAQERRLAAVTGAELSRVFSQETHWAAVNKNLAAMADSSAAYLRGALEAGL